MKNSILLNDSKFYSRISRFVLVFALSMVTWNISINAQKKSDTDVLNQYDYSMFNSAMSSMDMDEWQSNADGYTFFAPTNEAFRALGEETLRYLFSNPKEFAKILSYHFVSDKVYAGDLSDGQIVKMRNGADAFISLTGEKAYINQAEIVKTDVPTFNGVVHVIDAVITQPQSIVDIVVNSPRHETLEAAVIAAGLAGPLSEEGTFTLFAPTDDAFAELGQETINALLDDPTGALAEILKYHVVGAVALSGDLSDGDMFPTLEGSDIKVTINESGVFINDAQVLFADYQAPNGVVHVIDAVITPPAESNTVVDIIVNSDVHESLEAAVIAAELAGALAGEGPFTVFAPTDDAFAALGQETINALFANPTGALAEILKYHVVNGNVMSGELSDGQKVEMFEGTKAYISLFDEMAYINQAMITIKDIEADNGVVHVIDAVITQPKSIVDIVVNSPRHETLEAAVIAAGLAGPLSDEGTFTLFAPTDDAFAALGQETINALLADPTGALAEILKYHVVGAVALSGDLSDGDMFPTLEGSDIKVTINEAGVFINDAQVVFADYQAPNGVVHVIDAVITPPAESNTVVDIIVNSDVHESLEAAVIAAGLAGALAGEGPFTVFAPTDDAFAALGQETINALFANPTGALAEILKYHVVNGNVMSGELSDGQKVEMLEGTKAYISLFDEMAYINQAMITIKDIEADNGVVHVIDAVITQPKSIVDIVVNSPRHETLEAAVIAAGLAGPLSDEGTFTLFAPTDDAFAELGQETINALLADPTGALAEILKYHVVGAVALSGDLSDGDMFPTLEGSDIKVTINEAGVFINDAQVVFADYQAPNGVVHVIDAVITPPAESNTVVDIIVNSDVHESLEAAVIAAGLAGALAGEGPFTVFAPTDDAFAALGQETINALFANPTGALAEILKYHVVNGNVMSGELSDGQKVEMLEGTKAYISLFDEMAYINQAMITIKDIEADNGVVHVIDAVITQPKSILDLIAINPRLTKLLEIIYAAGLDEFLSSEGYFTIFAPTNEAWEEFIKDAFGGVFGKSENNYSNLLSNHTLGVEAYANDLFDGDIIQALAGLNIQVSVNPEGTHLNDAKIIYSDYVASNGVLHIINEVITEANSSIPTGLNDASAIFGNTNVYPNPATDRASLSFELMESSDVALVIHDVTGKIVRSTNYGRLETGYQELNLEIQDLESGMYIINVKTGSNTLSKKLRIK